MKVITIRNLKKTYRNGVEAVKGIDLDIEHHEVCALLGPNGAGKTTTLKSILGFIHYEGEIKVFGKPVDEVRDRISFVPAERSFYGYMNLSKAMKFCERFLPNFDSKKSLEMIEHFRLPMDKKIAGFSSGMKTGVYLSFTLAQEADLYILDEPTWGLDPIMRDEVLEMIREKVIQGKSVLYTSHIISEVEKISDRIYIMNKGKIRYSGSLDELKEEFRIFYLSAEAMEKLDNRKFFSLRREQGRIIVLSKDPEEWEELESLSEVEGNAPDLEEFFQFLIRGE